MFAHAADSWLAREPQRAQKFWPSSKDGGEYYWRFVGPDRSRLSIFFLTRRLKE